MNNQSPKAALIAPALCLSIFVWSALFAWQGLDFTDLGYSLVTYQQFYSAPETNAYGMGNWFTAFLGHWIGKSLGGTVLAHNLSASLVLALTGGIAYLGLQLVFSRGWALAGCVFVAFLFATKANANWINYNNLTGLFFTLGAVTVFFGLQRERPSWVFIAGSVLGANLFIRLPNLLGIGLVVAVILHGLLQRWPRRRTLRWSLLFVGGYLLSIILIAALILAHGHWDLYLQSLQGIFGKATNDDSSHSGRMLLSLFLRDHAYALALAGLTIGVGLLMLRLITDRPVWLRATLMLLSALVLAIAFDVIESWKWAVPGMLYVGLLWIALKEWRLRPQLALFAFIALTILLLAPIGSNNGIRNAVYGQWLAMPLLLIWLLRGGTNALLPIANAVAARRLAGATLTLTLVCYSMVASWFHSYRDSPERQTLLYSVDHPLLAGTYTTAERAQVVQELLTAVPSWITAGSTVLAYPSIPTFHFLTKTRSWLNNPWPVLYEAKGIEIRLENKRMENAPLPTVVRSLGNTRNNTWPINSPRDQSPIEVAAEAALDEFLLQNNYASVWSNVFFEILVPEAE